MFTVVNYISDFSHRINFFSWNYILVNSFSDNLVEVSSMLILSEIVFTYLLLLKENFFEYVGWYAFALWTDNTIFFCHSLLLSLLSDFEGNFYLLFSFFPVGCLSCIYYFQFYDNVFVCVFCLTSFCLGFLCFCSNI